LKRLRSRKFLQRLLLTISMTLLATSLIMATALYYNGERVLKRAAEKSNKQILDQIQYNLTFMDQQIRTFTMNLYMQEDTNLMMLFRSDDITEQNRLQNRLNSLLSTPFLHSMVIYNSFKNDYYSIGMDTDAAIVNLKDRIKRNDLPKFRIIPQLLEMKESDGSVRTAQVLSIYMYNFTPSNRSVMAVNVKSQWLYDNLALLKNSSEGYLLLMDEAGRVMNLDGETRKFAETAFVAQISGLQDNKLGTFPLDGEAYVVTTQRIEANGWRIALVKPYDVAFGSLARIKQWTVTFAVGFTLIMLFVAWWISRRLYSPIDSLVRQLQGDMAEEAQPPNGKGDEITYLSRTYSTISSRLALLQGDHFRQKQLVKNYYLRKMVLDSSSLPEREFRDIAARLELPVTPESRFLLCMLKLDDYVSFRDARKSSEKDLYRFAVTNIASEIIGAACPAEVIDMANDHFVVLIRSEGMPEDEEARLLAVIRHVQTSIEQLYGLSITAALSEEIASYRDITLGYMETAHIVNYRMVFGKQSLIVPRMVQANLRNPQLSLPLDMEKKMTDALKSGDRELLRQHLHAILQAVSKFHYHNIMHSLLRLIVLIDHTVKEINAYKARPIQFDAAACSKQLADRETLEDVYRLFDSILTDCIEQQQFPDSEKNELLVETIKRLIDEQFADPNLCQQSIADAVRMSSSYVGKLFKRSMSVTIPEYINELRLHKARQMLEKGVCTVNEISERVGYGNRSYFFKLFKKTFGVTPKEYQLARLAK